MSIFQFLQNSQQQVQLAQLTDGFDAEATYMMSCFACHSTGAAGAPKVGDAAAWADRIAKGQDVLYDHGVNGIPGTGMMAKGGCVNCSDEEVHAAVDYMIVNSQ